MSSISALPPAVVVHGAADVARACAAGLPLTLLSAPGAAVFAGPGWWIALARQACAAYPGLIAADLLDCADAPGLALAALRLGQRRLILDPTCPAFATVAATMRERGGEVHAERLPALDLADPRAERRLEAWLRDSAAPLR